MPLLVVGIRRTMQGLPDAHLDVRVMAGTCACAAAIGTAFGLTPLLLLRCVRDRALHAGGCALSASAWSIRFREALVAGQTALCLVLLTAAALLGRSFLRMSTTPTGLRVEHTTQVPHDLMPGRYRSWEARGRLYDEVLRRTGALAG